MTDHLFAHPVLLQGATARLLSLGTVDILIIAIYFVLVLVIGFYLKRFAKTGEDFFMAGREMTAWIAGLSFVAANLGVARADGLGRRGLPVRHPGDPLVLDRRHPGDALPGHRDDAVLLHLARRTRCPAT